MALRSLSHSQLMAESWWRIEAVARHGSPQQRHVIRRILEHPARWRGWEAQHSALMRAVALPRRAPGQLTALRRSSFALIHRKALFEYLRGDEGARRQSRRLLRLFRANTTHTQALILEHESYLDFSCSQICSVHIGRRLMADSTFGDPLSQYEAAYNSYFKSFCRCTLAEPADQSMDAERALLPYLKYELNRHRLVVLSAPRLTSEMVRDMLIRQPTGDTMRLVALSGTKKPDS